MKTWLRLVCALGLAVMGTVPAVAQAPAPTGTLRVTVVDQSGGVLPSAEVAITGQDDAMRSRPAVVASIAGVAVFDALPPGLYTVRVTFPGFQPATVPDVRVRAGDNREVVALGLRMLDEQTDVAVDAQTASLEPMGLSFSTVLTREMIDALPDDPEEMAAALEAMAPPGATFRVDGFSGGAMPHKSQIKSVRLPRMDEMAAQNHGGSEGFLFIDIKTQPGAGPVRGAVDGTFYNDALIANNPFTPVKGDEQTRQYSTSLAGTIVPNRMSFAINVGGTSQHTSPTLLAVLADGATVAEALRRPSDVTNVGVRIDYSLNPDHSVRVSFDRSGRETRNQGVGGFNLLDRAFRTTSTTNVIRLAEGGPVGRRLFSESRAQFSWSSSVSDAAFEVPTIRVIDAFTGGGAQVRGGQRQFEVEAATDLDYVRGMHSWRVGTLVEGGRYRSDDMTNYLGTYTFGSLDAFRAGLPSTYTRRVGDPNITYSAWQAGVYVQDDWRVARSVLVSAGVRAGVQTLVGDPFNVSPRLTVSWSPFRRGTLTLRGSYGYLYDWISGGLYKQAQLMDGNRLKEVNVTQPSYPEPPAAGPGSVSNRYLWSDELALPTNHRLNVGASQLLTRTMQVTAAYTYGRGSGQLRGRNLNAPDGGLRPDGRFANVVELVSDAAVRSHAVNLGWNLTKVEWRRSTFSVNYTWATDESNTTGAFALPANGDNLETEWGANRATHVVSASMNVTPMQNLNLNLSARGQSGAPYNITTGQDDNLDGLFNDRPAGVARNSARAAAQWDVNGKVSYAWRFGPPRPTVQRFNVVWSLSFQNLLNRANYVGYSGVMTSPFFLQPTNVVSPRRVQMGLRFAF